MADTNTKDMKKKKEKPRKPKYGFFSCVWYSFKLHWEADRKIALFLLFGIFFQLGVNAVAVYSPALLLWELEPGTTLLRLFAVVLALSAAKILFDAGERVYEDVSGYGPMAVHYLLQYKREEKRRDLDRFLLLSESLRGSAVNMAVNTITDAAEKEKEPYTPGIKTIERGSKESAEAFAERLLKSA